MGILLNKCRIGLILLMACASSMAYAEEPLVPPDQKVPVGERLVYKITWLRIPVGWGEIWVKEETELGGRKVIHVVGKVDTNKILSKIFPMHDEAHSWIDAQTYESLQFEKVIDEFLIHAHERSFFDAAARRGH